VQLFKLRLVAAFSMQINATELDAPFTGPPMPATIPLGYFFIFICVLLLHFNLISIYFFFTLVVGCILLLQLSTETLAAAKCIIEQFNTTFSHFQLSIIWHSFVVSKVFICGC